MKQDRRLLFLPILLILFLLGGCSTTSTTETGTATGPGTGSGGTTVAGTGTAGGTGMGAETHAANAGGGWTGSPLEDPNSPLSQKVIHFDFDSSEIRSEYLPVLRAHADFLVANPDLHVTIEGHCDERGSREYNMALGERRAKAVARFLEAEGVSPEQIETISYGEERPVDPGHNEAAWAKNRRAVLVYPGL